ncbi:MAG: peptidylprolyl isomerase [Polyangia bacterium]
MKLFSFGAIAVACALLVAACGSKSESGAVEESEGEAVDEGEGRSQEVDRPAAGKDGEEAGEGESESGGSVSAAEPEPVQVPNEKLSASHILLMFKEAPKARSGVERTREEAEKLAAELHEKLKKGADLAELAREHSDCPSGEREGGDLGVFPARKMVPEFSRALLEMGVGEISEPVETPFGFHIIKRQQVLEAHARHILVMHEGSKRRPSSVTRSKKEARELIEQLEEKLEEGADFAELAREHSDCPSGKRAGGDLGTFSKGDMSPEFEKTAFQLEEKEISDVVETDFGFHLIQRLP